MQTFYTDELVCLSYLILLQPIILLVLARLDRSTCKFRKCKCDAHASILWARPVWKQCFAVDIARAHNYVETTYKRSKVKAHHEC